MLRTMARYKVLEIVGDWDALTFDGAEEVLHDRVYTPLA